MKDYWFSAYDQSGRQFGITISAENVDSAINQFYDKYPDCEIADYGDYDE